MDSAARACDSIGTRCIELSLGAKPLTFMPAPELLAEAQPLLSMLGPFDGFFDKVFDNFLFRPWPGSVFARPTWTTITNTLSVGLALVVSGLLMVEQRARRLGKSLPEKQCRRVGIAVTVIGFLLYFDFFVPNVCPRSFRRSRIFYNQVSLRVARMIFKNIYTL